MKWTALVMMLMITPALAAPPDEGSEDWQVMHPYKAWIEAQKQTAGNPGGSCCDWSDGRPVTALVCSAQPIKDAHDNWTCGLGVISDIHWWAFEEPRHWPGVRPHWVQIPDELVGHEINPVGLPMMWIAVPHKPGISSGTGGSYSMSYVEGPVDPDREPHIYCFCPPSGV
jgi:hypothetical protein